MFVEKTNFKLLKMILIEHLPTMILKTDTLYYVTNSTTNKKIGQDLDLSGLDHTIC